jgi:vacuolar protein sorting-associated protein 13A/C
MKARISATLSKGSFALKTTPHGDAREVTSVVFDVFQANFIQRPDNFEASVSLGGLGVFDGTTKNTLHPQIVRVKDIGNASDLAAMEVGSELSRSREPFFFIKFERNPLDERADNALTMRMRHMEIIYQRGYVEAIYNFFKPPESQLESVEAFLVSLVPPDFVKLTKARYQNVASQTLEGLRKETRAGLEFALQTHKTVDVHMDMNAPVIIIPEEYAFQHFHVDD